MMKFFYIYSSIYRETEIEIENQDNKLDLQDMVEVEMNKENKLMMHGKGHNDKIFVRIKTPFKYSLPFYVTLYTNSTLSLIEYGMTNCAVCQNLLKNFTL